MPRARKPKAVAVPAEAPVPAVAAEVRDARAALATATGSDDLEVQRALLSGVIGALGLKPGTELHEQRSTAAFGMLTAFAPRDAVEAMLAGQAIALNDAGMVALRRSAAADLPHDVASRLRRDATSMFRASADLVGAIEARRGGGARQRIVVEHISQAIIGAPGEGFRE